MFRGPASPSEQYRLGVVFRLYILVMLSWPALPASSSMYFCFQWICVYLHDLLYLRWPNLFPWPLAFTVPRFVVSCVIGDGLLSLGAFTGCAVSRGGQTSSLGSCLWLSHHVICRQSPFSRCFYNLVIGGVVLHHAQSAMHTTFGNHSEVYEGYVCCCLTIANKL